MRRTHRYLITLMAVAVMTLGLALPAYAGPASSLISRINSSRTAAGLAPLESYWDLTDDAVAQSGRMLQKGEIFHNTSLGSVTGVWQGLGENVGMGVDLAALHSAFMASPSHRANILGDYNYVGVGVKTDAEGVSWVTVVFMKAAPGLNGGTTTTTTAPPTTTTTAPPVATPVVTTTAPPAPATTTTTSAPAQAAAVKASNKVVASVQTSTARDIRYIGISGKLNIWD